MLGYYILIGLIALVSFAVSSKLKSKFEEYSHLQLRNGMSGAEIATQMLHDHGIYDVKVISTPGQLTDHYNPMDKTVNLSPDVYYGRNAAATAVAAHECGHAVQHATSYVWLNFRSAMVPVQNISGKILNIVLIASLFGGFALGLPYHWIGYIVVGSYSVMTLFTLVTLPVEFDASNRALAWVQTRNVVTRQEYDMSKDALKWAAMTYVVAALASLVTLAYYIFVFFGNRD